MSDKIRATVGILTYNSATTLERALKSVKEFDDILICDGGSTDQTIEIARRYGARVISQPQHGPIQDFSAVRNHYLQAATYDWFLYIDSDETAEEGLVEEIRGIVEKNPDGMHVYNISPRIIYKGELIEYSSNYPGYQIRFFKRNPGVHYDKPIHERIVYPSDTAVHVLQGHWNYYLESPDEMLGDLKRRDIPAVISRYEKKPFSRKLFGVKNEIYSMGVILLKSAWHASVHPKHHMPWEIERTRLTVHWYSMLTLLGVPNRYAPRS